MIYEMYFFFSFCRWWNWDLERESNMTKVTPWVKSKARTWIRARCPLFFGYSYNRESNQFASVSSLGGITRQWLLKIHLWYNYTSITLESSRPYGVFPKMGRKLRSYLGSWRNYIKHLSSTLCPGSSCIPCAVSPFHAPSITLRPKLKADCRE